MVEKTMTSCAAGKKGKHHSASPAQPDRLASARDVQKHPAEDQDVVEDGEILGMSRKGDSRPEQGHPTAGRKARPQMGVVCWQPRLTSRGWVSTRHSVFFEMDEYTGDYVNEAFAKIVSAALQCKLAEVHIKKLIAKYPRPGNTPNVHVPKTNNNVWEAMG